MLMFLLIVVSTLLLIVSLVSIILLMLLLRIMILLLVILMMLMTPLMFVNIHEMCLAARGFNCTYCLILYPEKCVYFKQVFVACNRDTSGFVVRYFYKDIYVYFIFHMHNNVTYATGKERSLIIHTLI